jgi:3-oxoacyl-[acyl-carrier protein] reductase
MDLKSRTVVITGAARGLGAAIAEGLASRGANVALVENVALVDLDADSLKATHQACGQFGVTSRCYAANVAEETQVISCIGQIAEDFGRIDGLVNNAGILRDGLLVKAKQGEIANKMSLDDWQAVIDVNLTGVFLFGREAAERMILFGNGGCIVNISSISRFGNFGQSNYSAAKAGVAALTVVWSKELARHGIRVNAIAPGFVNTEMVASMKPEVLERAKSHIPLGRLCEPDEIAHAAIYLFENDYMDGRVVEIDGAQRL